MSLIHGRNGRIYKDGKRIESVSHPETRDRETLRAARAAQQPRQPSGIAIVDPFAATLDAETRRKGKYWRDSEAGRRFAAEMTAKSEAWQAEQADAKSAAGFAASVQPMVDHAERTLTEAELDSEVSVAELETLRANVELARAGNHDAYKVADNSWRDIQRTKLEEKAHGHDSIIREHQAERDRILADAWEREPEPVPAVTTPTPLPVLTGKVAVVRKVQTEHGVREVLDIQDA